MISTTRPPGRNRVSKSTRNHSYSESRAARLSASTDDFTGSSTITRSALRPVSVPPCSVENRCADRSSAQSAKPSLAACSLAKCRTDRPRCSASDAVWHASSTENLGRTARAQTGNSTEP